ncbi:response regulator transcription factor [Lachnospiraceae bacterium DSM 108991]|uniref:Stage 0 sporulation protein A homolog n=1 Tax=Claveliimonas monacensis TaxID=2779351 RepID=A0ABR9RLL0_9FIRM|nr:LytTR family DNA-binding domain-containing protein [Claveliimonas monacensis]MBE5063866.1 response regulator transcription factor [Claveliimonas monacensis]
MIRIAVCDDEKHFVDQIKEILLSYNEKIEDTIYVEEFYDGIMLLDKYDCRFDIIFLDIKMPYMDGIKVAEKIREKDKDVTILFLTSLLGRAVDGYRVKAENFLIKPIERKKVLHEIDRYIMLSRMKKQLCILVENIEGQFRIPITSLKYIETYNRNLLIHTEDQAIVCYKKLKELKEELKNYGFAQSHKGYLINLSYVKSIKGNDIMLTTNEVLPISRAMKKEFMQQLAIYMGGQL